MIALVLKWHSLNVPLLNRNCFPVQKLKAVGPALHECQLLLDLGGISGSPSIRHVTMNSHVSLGRTRRNLNLLHSNSFSGIVEVYEPLGMNSDY